MEFSELLKKRRSIRLYKEKDVSTELVKEVIAEACLAPSSGNGQTWKFIIVNDREMIKRISDESKASLLADIDKNPNSRVKKYEDTLKNETFNVFYNAPCLVLIVGEKSYRSLAVDCTLAATYFMLSATAKGLGTCWIGLGSQILDADLRKEIGLDDGLSIVAPMVIGYPEMIPDPTERSAPDILKVIE